MSLPYQHVCVVDFETHYSQEYSLRAPSLSMTDYIRDERFETQCVSVFHETWEAPVTVPGWEAGELLNSIDWTITAFAAHHCQFDGLIMTHHYGLFPCFWVDTISMYRMLHGVDVPAGLVAAGPRYGFKGKPKADALKNVKGLRLANMSPELLALLMEYNEDDTFQTMGIYKKMRPHIPDAEMRIIDLTVSMYTEPVLELDEQRLAALHKREVDRRAETVVAAGVDTVTLGSAQRFADHLRSLGVDPPIKKSPRTGKLTYAFAKTDLEFKALLKHENPEVRAAVEARLCTKSALVEDRSARLLKRVGLPTPMYYNYWAARTGRWGGGDKVNWQNLAKKGDGAELRKSLSAPDGAMLVIADASQIEARKVAWLADDTELLHAFANNEDVYAINGSGMYGRPINKHDDPDERFASKVLSLSCQYGAGGAKVSNVFRLGNLGPPVDISVAEAKELVAKWRFARHRIVALWGELGRAAENAWLRGVETELGPVVFERFKNDGYMHLPNGTYMKYPEVGWSEDFRSLYYNSKNGAVKVWGGYLLENVAQSLCCALLKQQMLDIVDTWDGPLRMAATTHDEIILVVRAQDAQEVAELVEKRMSQPESWCEGIPLHAEVEVSKIYSKV